MSIKPSDNLMALAMACRVHFTWLGTRKSLTTSQKNEAAEHFNADGSAISASKRLLNTKHSAYRAVSAIKSQARAYWNDNTLPWPEPGVRLLRRAKLDEFVTKMKEFQLRLCGAVADLNAKYPELRDAARADLGKLYDDNDYQDTLSGAFAIDWDFPSVEPPPYLATLSPERYKEETARMAARFEEATRLAEQAFAEEFAAMIAHLSDKLTDGPEGRKTFKASAITNLTEFCDRFKQLNVGCNAELETMISKAQDMLKGVDAKDVRKDDGVRADLKDQLSQISKSLESSIVVAPKRRIIGIVQEQELVLDTVAA